MPGNENPSILISFATKSSNAGQVTSKLHVIELGAQPGTRVPLQILLPLFIVLLGRTCDSEVGDVSAFLSIVYTQRFYIEINACTFFFVKLVC